MSSQLCGKTLTVGWRLSTRQPNLLVSPALRCYYHYCCFFSLLPFSAVAGGSANEYSLGSGPAVRNQIKGIADHTLDWIERDMQQGRETSAPPTPAPAVRLKKEKSAPDAATKKLPKQPPKTEQPKLAVTTSLPDHAQQMPPQPRSAPPQTELPTVGAFFPDSGLAAHASYVGMNYSDSAQANALLSPSYGGEATSMFYPNTSMSATTTGRTPTQTTGSTEASGNPNIAFAPQAPQHADSSAQLFWQRSGGNAWHDWTAAMAQAPFIYNAEALAGLGASAGVGPAQTDTSASLAGNHPHQAFEMQWPLLLFDQQGSQPGPPHIPHLPHAHVHSQPHQQQNPHLHHSHS